MNKLRPHFSGLKWSILIVQKLGLHKNGVDFCQQFNGTIRTSLTASDNDIGEGQGCREICYTETQGHKHTVKDETDYIAR